MEKDYKEIQNLKEMMQEVVRKYKNNIAFRIKEKNEKQVEYKDVNYEQFLNDINSLGTSMLHLDLKNKRVVVISKNRYEWIIAYLATLNGVGTVVPLDKSLPETELISLLKRSQAEVIIFEKEFVEVMNKVQVNNDTNLKEYICMDNVDEYKYMYDLMEQGKKAIEGGDKSYINAEIDNDKVSILLYTSGTTSEPKAVMLSHRNIASNIYGLWLSQKIYQDDINIAFLPYHHTFGCTNQLFFSSHGTMTVFCDGLRYVQENLKEYKVTIFVGVPLLVESMYKKIMIAIEKKGKMNSFKLATKLSNFLRIFKIDLRKKLFKEVLENLGGGLRFVVNGAAALDPKVQKGFNDLGILLVQGYGLTETSPVLTAENHNKQKIGSSGIAIPGVLIKIDNPDSSGIGEIIVKGPNVMKGYYENEKATNEVLKNGWFHTGDLGRMDKDGFLFITGRKKNVIVLKNGKNIYPEELEVLINNLKYVNESMVFGAPKDDDLLLSAKIVYNEEYFKELNANITEEEIEVRIWEDVKLINKGLVNYKYIKNIIVSKEEMIKTTTSKVKRHEEIKKMNKEKNI